MAQYGFVVSAVKNRLSGSKATYSARIRHLDVIRGDDLFKDFGKYMAMNPTLAKSLVDGLGGYIRDKLLDGYKLDFGAFKVGLTIRGGFSAANGEFDPKRNKVCISLTPSVELKKAVAAMRPENLTVLETPVLQDAFCPKYSTRLGRGKIVCRVECGMNGEFPIREFTGEDDGVWLEDAEGRRIAKARVLSVDATRLSFIIDEDVPFGRYRLFVGCRAKGQIAVSSDSKWVEVVAEPLSADC